MSEETPQKHIIGIKNLSNNDLPKYLKDGDAGFDFRAFVENPVTIEPFKRAVIGTGLYFELGPEFEMQIRSRSGLAATNGVAVLNSPGTIDSGYRGEIKIILINLGDQPFTVNNGDRIAQGVIAPSWNNKLISLVQVNEISTSERSTGGLGSTGIN